MQSAELNPAIAIAAETPQVELISIDQTIKDAAIRYKVSENHLYKTLQCESGDFQVLDGQSEVLNPTGPNGRENSWGIAQFHFPTALTTSSGTLVTMAIAKDPVQAIDAAAYNFSIGNASQWTCYRDGVKNGWK